MSGNFHFIFHSDSEDFLDRCDSGFAFAPSVMTEWTHPRADRDPFQLVCGSTFDNQAAEVLGDFDKELLPLAPVL